MKEELAVLEFFSQPENLPLALSVAEQADRLREQLNSQFWHGAILHLLNFTETNALGWHIAATEDRNAPDTLVGLHCAPDSEQSLYLRPMMEQQNLGKGLQIYFGLMWSTPPTPEHLTMPAVSALSAALTADGYKGNENFMAWQWTTLYPRSKSFLLRYTNHPEQVMTEIENTFGKLMLKHHVHITHANLALAAAPRSMAISLDKLHVKRKA